MTKYIIFDANKITIDTTNMRKSIDGTKVIYHENLTGEDLPQYTHAEILEILKSAEWCEQGVQVEPELETPTLEERVEAIEMALLEVVLNG